MAFKAIMGLGFLVILINMDQSKHVSGAEMDTTDERWGKDYEKPKETDQAMMNMMGKPMMCYQKKKVMNGGNGNDNKGNRIFEQSARLLSMVMERIRSGEGLDIEFIQQATAALQNMTKNTTDDTVNTEEDTDLGMELMNIVDRLLQSGQTSGISISGEESVENDGGMSEAVPMNDNHETAAPRIPLPEGFDLSSFGLSMTELLDLFKDPSMAFMFESLGLGPFLQYMRNDTVIAALSALDIDSFNGLLLSGNIFNTDGDVDLEAIERAAGILPQEEDNNNPLFLTFSSMMAILGIEDELTTDNLIPTFLRAVLLINATDDTIMDDLVGILDGISEEDLETYGMLDGMKSLEEMREGVDSEMMMIFDAILVMAGIEENVTKNNLMEALIRAMRFVVTADDSMLITIWEIIRDMDFMTSTEESEEPTGGRSRSTASEISTTATTTRMPVPEPTPQGLSATKRMMTNSMGQYSTTSTTTRATMPTSRTMAMPGRGNTVSSSNDILATLQQLMTMAGVQGEVTEENLMESVIQAMQYIFSADNDTLTAFLEVLDGMSMQNGSSAGRISMGGMQGNVRAIFNRIMALAGVSEVTEENLMDSVIQAMRYLLTANDETIAGILAAIGDFSTIGGNGDVVTTRMETMDDSTVTTTNPQARSTMRYTTEAPGMTRATKQPPMMGSNRGIVDVFRRILLLTGNGREITEDNVIEQTLSAMQFIIQADPDTLALILEEFNKINLEEAPTSTTENDKDEMQTTSQKGGYEMICYPMSEDDMKKYMRGKMQQSGSKGNNGSMSTEHSMGRKPSDTTNKTMDMKCRSCKSDEELRLMMEDMVKEEVSRVFADVVTNINGINAVPSEVQVFLAKMANGMLVPGTEAPLEPTSSTPGARNNDNRPVTKWEEWSSFGPCGRTCGGGDQVRSRVCTVLYQAENPDDNDCEETETVACNVMPCEPESSTWLEWEEWQPCSTTCGQGTSTRRRECVRRTEGESCEQVQAQSCSSGPCPTTPTPSTTTMAQTSLPFWREWEEWGPCSLTCGLGVATRRRTCNRPDGTSNCLQIETQNCMPRTCVIPPRTPSTPRAPVFSLWGNWGVCSRTCDGGLRRRTRTCLSGSCSGRFEQIGQCNNARCPTVSAGPRITNPGVLPTVTYRSTQLPRTSRSVLSTSQVGGSCPGSLYRTLRYGGKCIVFYGRQFGMKTFVEYREFCQQRGGDLVRAENVETWVQIAYWIRTIASESYRQVRSDLTWIGATDAGEQGRWSHPADRLMRNKRTFIIWKRGEPKAVGYDQCATLEVSSGHAISARCSERRYAICEY